ncbi:SDR family NAD(P)-dependent oxidoreductase [Sneathiella glossodoripedis]|uniref:SDR family NAD(P)-dependent oxidoreductase n=1 Tax=Sneathiella glossodoripedis TaxID=418853 RepID=UPI00046EEB88|nr:SDR family NAD(P)-dependent oxidoreductase [Sneathiella glossodoripedis]
MVENVAIIGASGALGAAFTSILAEKHENAVIHAISRQKISIERTNIETHQIDYSDESELKELASRISAQKPLDLVVVATGILHTETLKPEKSLRNLSEDKFRQIFEANTIRPALFMKYFLPTLGRDRRSVFAALSARVGSISDNHLGGWYGYRASKSALNMLIRCAAIEMGRTHPKSIIVGLHPGTVDSDLSKPFQSGVPKGKLFTPHYSAACLTDVLAEATPTQSGQCLAYDGSEVKP